MRRIRFEIVVTEGMDYRQPHPFDEGKPHEPQLISTVGITWKFEDRIYGNHIKFDKPALTEEEIAEAGKELMLSAMDAAREKGIEIETHTKWRRIPGTNQVERILENS